MLSTNKKTIRKLILCLVSIPLASSLFSVEATALSFSGGRPSANFTAYYTESVSSYGYVSAYDDARFSWNDTADSVNITRVLNANGTPDKYYVGVTSIATRLGQQEGFKRTSTGGYIAATANETWAYSNVSIYHNNIEKFGLTRQQIVSNATHEIGHSLAQDHVPDNSTINSVMRQGVQNIGPTSYDMISIRNKWGN